LATLIISELLRAYTTRSEKHTIFKIGLFSNRSMNLATIVSFSLLIIVFIVPQLRDIFNVATLHFQDWDIVLLFAILPFLSGELNKVIKFRKRKV
jgi:Ca2+-transporting ATPase